MDSFLKGKPTQHCMEIMEHSLVMMGSMTIKVLPNKAFYVSVNYIVVCVYVCVCVCVCVCVVCVCVYYIHLGFPGGSVVKILPAMHEMQETRVQSLGQEDFLEEGMATHSRILTWRILWTEELGRLQAIESKRV